MLCSTNKFAGKRGLGMDWEEVSITDLEAWVSPEILDRGREYQRTGHILRVCRFGKIIAGEVAGTGEPYRVRITLDETGVDAACTCPYPGFCKHMVALVLAWIEKSADFRDVGPDFNGLLTMPERLAHLLARLIQMDPLNFLDALSTDIPERTFLNSRVVLNLIRNTFRGQLLTHDQVDALWERIQRIKKSVAKAVEDREKDAPQLLRELLRGVAYSHQDYPSLLLKNTYSELLLLADDFLEDWPWEEVSLFFEILWDLYLEPSLWELADETRPVLVKIFLKFPKLFMEHLEVIDWSSIEQPRLINLYELLSLTIETSPVGAEYFRKVLEVLSQTTEGKLWLIDRLVEEDPDRAFGLAKEGLRNSTKQDKQSFRERLIEIHLRRSENKQAAALCFIQFQERPNLEEYLRLKTILAGRKELQVYLKRIDKLTEESGYLNLGARIAYDQEDWLKLLDKIMRLEPADVTVKEIAVLIIADRKMVPFEVYEALIVRLLMGPRNNWEIVLRLLVNCKKTCLKCDQIPEWEELRSRLNAEYGGDQRFTRKFGSILAG